ncbi:MAG TPA: GIY-YIG nuclease family protein [Sphingomonas sp.]|nr:GIY-YIG nuclease family protein [Sphingomonas sp.]
MNRQACVYILASAPRGTLYVGVTSDLIQRLDQHRRGAVPGFTARYNVKRLAYFEMAESMEAAIAREKQLKRWHRDWKLNLIERQNPHWGDLAIGLGFEPLEARARHHHGP